MNPRSLIRQGIGLLIEVTLISRGRQMLEQHRTEVPAMLVLFVIAAGLLWIAGAAARQHYNHPKPQRPAFAGHPAPQASSSVPHQPMHLHQHFHNNNWVAVAPGKRRPVYPSALTSAERIEPIPVRQYGDRRPAYRRRRARY